MEGRGKRVGGHGLGTSGLCADAGCVQDAHTLKLAHRKEKHAQQLQDGVRAHQALVKVGAGCIAGT